jgi:hypothetical protein
MIKLALMNSLGHELASPCSQYKTKKLASWDVGDIDCGRKGTANELSKG